MLQSLMTLCHCECPVTAEICTSPLVVHLQLPTTLLTTTPAMCSMLLAHEEMMQLPCLELEETPITSFNTCYLTGIHLKYEHHQLVRKIKDRLNIKRQ